MTPAGYNFLMVPLKGHTAPPLTVGMDVRVVGANRRGFEIYVRELVAALARVAPENRYRLYAPHPVPDLEGLGNSVQTVLLPKGIHSLDWTHRRLPRRMRDDGVDVVHFPASSIWFRNPQRVVVTVHDLAFFLLRESGLTPPLIDLYHRLQFAWIARAARVLVVSHRTRQDLLARHPRLGGRVRVVPGGLRNGFAAPPSPEIDSFLERSRIQTPYALFVGGLDRRKNLEALLAAWERLPGIRLVIAGPTGRTRGARSRSPEELLAPHPSLAERVRFLGYVDDDDLPALYAGARLFILPSLYEGFGLPLLEAMACRTPVTCSNLGSLPEVGGDAVLLFDPHSVEQIASAVQRLWTDEELAARLVRRGIEQLNRFTWDRAARATEAVYQEVAGKT